MFFKYSTPFFSPLHYMYVGIPNDVLQVSEALSIFLHSLFFLFLRLADLSGHIFKFADCFFCLLIFTVAPPVEFFILFTISNL